LHRATGRAGRRECGGDGDPRSHAPRGIPVTVPGGTEA
jgi:hypothetical protein